MSHTVGASLEVIPLDKKVKVLKKIRQLNPLLPKPPFRMALVGSSNSGKTTFLCNLFRKQFYGSFWRKEHIFVFSPTASLDDKLKACIPAHKGQFYEAFDPAVIDEIYTTQHEIYGEYGATKLDHILIILDDMLGTDAMAANSILTKYIFKTRHYNVSLIYSVQKYTGLPRIMRLNSDVMAIFRCSNMGEVDSIAEENADKSSRKRFRQLLIDIFSEPFQFLFVDYQCRDLSKRYRRGMNDFIDFKF